MENWPGMALNGAGRFFFRPIQTLPTFWATWISILRISNVCVCLNSKILNFLTSPNLEFLASKARWQLFSSPTTQDIATCLAIIMILMLLRFLDFQISTFLDSRLPRFPSRMAGFGRLESLSAALPDLKVQEIQGTRQNP